jgi:hypothetical protein
MHEKKETKYSEEEFKITNILIYPVFIKVQRVYQIGTNLTRTLSHLFYFRYFQHNTLENIIPVRVVLKT